MKLRVLREKNVLSEKNSFFVNIGKWQNMSYIFPYKYLILFILIMSDAPVSNLKGEWNEYICT